MAKKLALVLVLLLAAVLVLTACTVEDYTATPLTGDTSGEVESNGGLAVVKGDYLYYVNGSQASSANDNTYGSVEIGSIVRISLENFRQAMMSSNTVEVINNTSKVLVPKMVYTANTTEKKLNGIFIFGDRIYYATPDTTIDRDGAAQYTRLALKSCKLDGTDTKHHYIFDKNSYTVALAEVGGRPYAAFVQNSNLYLLDLSKENVTPSLVFEGVASIKYDTTGNAFFTNSSNDIYSYVFGGQPKLVEDNPTVEGQSQTSVRYSLVNAQNGVLYYSVTSTYNFESQGVYSLTLNGTKTKLSTYVPSSYLGTDGKLLVYESANYSLNLFDPATKSSTPLVISKESKAITLTGIQDGNAVYVSDNKTYMVPLDSSDEAVRLTEVKQLSNWAQADLCGGYAFFIADEAETRGHSVMAVELESPKLTQKIVMRGYIPKTN